MTAQEPTPFPRIPIARPRLRPAHAPTFYLEPDHPGVIGTSFQAWTYSFDASNFANFLDAVADVPIPNTESGASVEASGMIVIDQDVVVYARDAKIQPIDRSKDIPVLIVQNHDVPSSPVRENIQFLRDREQELFGAPNERDGTKKGGVPIEQGLIASRQGPRTYQTAITLELPTRRAHPAKNINTGRRSSEQVDLLQSVNEHTNIIACEPLKVLPQIMHSAVSRHADLVNLPSVGSNRNKGWFTSCQLNIASGISRSANASRGLVYHLNRAGVVHGDRKDWAAGFSSIFSFADYDPEVMHPGHMCVTDLLVCCPMTPYRTMSFSALRPHGATPPRCILPRVSVPKSYVRAVVVWYPEAAVVQRKCSFEHLYVTPGSRIEIDQGFDVPRNRLGKATNFTQDGAGLLSVEDNANFLAREAYSLLQAYLGGSQHAGSLRIASASAFFDNLHYVDTVGGEIGPVDPWALAPCHDDARAESQRRQVQKDFEDLEAWISSANPSVSVTPKPRRQRAEAAADDGRDSELQNDEDEDRRPTKKPRSDPSPHSDSPPPRVKCLPFRKSFSNAKPEFYTRHPNLVAGVDSSSPQSVTEGTLAHVASYDTQHSRGFDFVLKCRHLVCPLARQWESSKRVKQDEALARAETMLAYFSTWKWISLDIRAYLDGMPSDGEQSVTVPIPESETWPVNVTWPHRIMLSVNGYLTSRYPLQLDPQYIFDDCREAADLPVLSMAKLCKPNQYTNPANSTLVALALNAIADWTGLRSLYQSTSKRRENRCEWDFRGQFLLAILKCDKPGLLLEKTVFDTYRHPLDRCDRTTDDRERGFASITAFIQTTLEQDEEKAHAINSNGNCLVEDFPHFGHLSCVLANSYNRS